MIWGCLVLFACLFYGEGGHTLKQIAQRGCRVSILRNIQNQTGQCSELPVVVYHVWSGAAELDDLQNSLSTATML